MVGDEDQHKNTTVTRSFTIKVGDKKFLRLVDSSNTRKRRSDDLTIAGTKILNDQIQKISYKKARIQTEDKEYVEPV